MNKPFRGVNSARLARPTVPRFRRRSDERLVATGLSVKRNLAPFPDAGANIWTGCRPTRRSSPVDGVLATLAFDLDCVFDPAGNPLQPRPEMSNVYRAIGEELEMEPTMYLLSSTDDAEVCWLMYSYGLNIETGATFAMSPMIDRVMKAIYRRLEGHHFLGERMRPDSFPFFTLVMLAAAEVAIRPSRAKEFAHLLRRAGGFSRLRDTLRMHYIVVQQAPKVDAAHARPGRSSTPSTCTLKAG